MGIEDMQDCNQTFVVIEDKSPAQRIGLSFLRVSVVVPRNTGWGHVRDCQGLSTFPNSNAV